MNKLILLVTIAFLIICGLYFIRSFLSPRLFKDYEQKSIKIGKNEYQLYVADSEQKRLKGLSGVTEMPHNQGMLFIFDTPNTFGFWMKDMNFSLDFVYIRKNKVTELKEDISPGTFPQIFYPVYQADAVIELNAGQIQQSGVHIGDSVVTIK